MFGHFLLGFLTVCAKCVGVNLLHYRIVCPAANFHTGFFGHSQQFNYWVTSEVLPSIRKHGTYMTPEIIEEAISNPDTMIRITTELKVEREKRRVLEMKVPPRTIFLRLQRFFLGGL